MKLTSLLAIAILSVFMMSCASQKKDEQESIREFVSRFHQSLQEPMENTLALFRTHQSKEAIEKAISILKNHPDSSVSVIFQHERMSYRLEHEVYLVDIPLILKSRNDEEETTVSIYIKAYADGFKITQFEGESFYRSYQHSRNKVKWHNDYLAALASYQPIIDVAQLLQEKYDTVVWYTEHDSTLYFYVVNGSWNVRNRDSSAKMGLIQNGEEVIPPAYTLIKTIGFDWPNIVEVQQGDSIGLFDVKKRNWITDQFYEEIIPTKTKQTPNVLAIVKYKDEWGFIDDQFTFQSNLQDSAVFTWIEQKQYIHEHERISAETKSICVIPSPNYLGRGSVIPPKYLTSLQLFEPIIDEIIANTSDQFEDYGSEFQETTTTVFNSLENAWSAIIVGIKGRYIGGREEFYEHDKVVLENPERTILTTLDIYGKIAHIKTITNTLIEIRSIDMEFWEPYPMDMVDPSNYEYYDFIDNAYERLKSNRVFKPSSFVKLDSSYFIGDFTIWNDDYSESEKSNFVSVNTLKYYRNEILAEYGMIFHGEENHWKHSDWYDPRFESINEFEHSMTIRDRHNVKFIDKLIELSQQQDVISKAE